MRKKLLSPPVMAVCGLAIGVIARMLDIYTQNLGEIFSQMAVWILLGALISVYSPSPKRAAVNVLLFCLGMLATYYAAAALTHGVYSRSFVIGWTVFALCTPVMAALVWYTKEKGWLGRAIAAGVVAAAALSSVVLFGGFRIYDAVIDGALIYLLFFKKVRRGARSS